MGWVTLCSRRWICRAFRHPAIRQSSVAERRDAPYHPSLYPAHSPRVCPYPSCRSLEGVCHGLCALVNLSNYPYRGPPSPIASNTVSVPPAPLHLRPNPRFHPLRTGTPPNAFFFLFLSLCLFFFACRLIFAFETSTVRAAAISAFQGVLHNSFSQQSQRIFIHNLRVHSYRWMPYQIFIFFISLSFKQ